MGELVDRCAGEAGLGGGDAARLASYLWIGVVSCREMLPDPAFYMECLRAACDELIAAAGMSTIQDAAYVNREPLLEAAFGSQVDAHFVDLHQPGCRGPLRGQVRRSK